MREITQNEKSAKPHRITEEKLLMVEGKDEKNFFQTFLDKKGIKEVQVIPVGGKDNFSNNLPEIVKLPEFESLKSLAIIRDADKSAESAFKSLCSALDKNSLPTPRQIGEFVANASLKVGVFIIPDGKSSGMLESLCFSIVKPEGKNIIECVNSFMECIKELPQKGQQYKQPKNWEKAKVRAFLSAMEEDTSSLGVATQKGYWNLDSDNLKPLLKFLKDL